MEGLAELYSIYHHLGLHRSDHGYRKWQTRLARYQERLRGLPVWQRRREEEALDAIVPLPEAVQRLASSDAPHLKRHAAAGVVQGAWLAERDDDCYAKRMRPRRGRGPREQVFRREHLEALLAGEDGAGIVSVLDHGHETPEQVFLALLERLHPCCEVDDWKVLQAEIDADDVTTFSAHIGAKVPDADPLRYDARSDPRRWAETLPESFLASFVVTLAPTLPQVPDVYQDPPQLGAAQTMASGSSWRGSFFEFFALQVFPPLQYRVSKLRNVLEIDYAVTPPKLDETGKREKPGRIDMKYSLNEALTNAFGPYPSAQGGLDVDSGEGCVECPEAGRIQLSARKSLRFTPCMPLYALFNLTALPFLTMWLSLMLIEGICPREQTDTEGADDGTG